MEELAERLFGVERELATGGGDAYRRHLAADAVVIVPGQTLGREEVVAAMDASPGWDEVHFEDRRLRALGERAALLRYRFAGRRGETRYEAEMTSAYVEEGDGWRLVHHQQTPVEPAAEE